LSPQETSSTISFLFFGAATLKRLFPAETILLIKLFDLALSNAELPTVKSL
jgi:hypothetical protein